MKIIEFLKLKETINISNLDDPSTAIIHAEILQKKPFLKKLYMEFYNQFKEAISVDSKKNRVFIEIGSGRGFIKDIIPEVITSDIIKLPHLDKHFSAVKMPLKNNSVDAFFMLGVLHHIEDAQSFFIEASRCLKVGGKMIMIEPANTFWGRFIWKNFHHEEFDSSGGWKLNKTGPLSSANGAIPWIIFCRDRVQFEREFSSLKILRIKYHTPFLYLVSGGFAFRQLAPSCAYFFFRTIEMILSPLNKFIGMFWTIQIEKTDK